MTTPLDTTSGTVPPQRRVQCAKCGESFEPRVAEPKSCPRCKRPRRFTSFKELVVLQPTRRVI